MYIRFLKQVRQTGHIRDAPLLWPLRLPLASVERKLGKGSAANLFLGWYPKALVGSGFLEAVVAHDEPEADRRIPDRVRSLFGERGMVILAAQVDFRARLIHSIGVPPAGFSANCSILEPEKYGTLNEKASQPERVDRE